MRWSGPLLACVLAVVLAASGCVGLPSHEDRTQFRSEGAYDLAVAAGADVLRAREDPGVRGHFFPSLPMSSKELDAAWGEGRYALASIHWWGPPGPPATTDDGADHTTVEVRSTDWQGFLIGRGRMQVIVGDVPEETARVWFDEMMVNLTDLSPDERDDLADQLFGDCGICGMPAPEGIDAGGLWQDLGGLEAATEERVRPASGRLSIGSWWFAFDWAEATLGSGLIEQTALRVGANDVVEFIWQSDRTHSDEASWHKLAETVRGVGITPPDPSSLEWVHQEVYYD